MKVWDARVVRTIGLALVIVAGNAQGADCPWLPVAKVEQALPHLRPWTVGEASAAGHCDFSSSAASSGGALAGYPKLTFTQQLHASASEARDSLKIVRDEGSTADYTIQRVPALGAEALVLLPTPKAMHPQSTSWMGHRDAVGLFASWTGESPLTGAERKAMESLIVAALNTAVQPAVAAQTAACPFWDENVVKKLLAGKDFRVQQFGADQCGASVTAGGVVILVSSTEPDGDSAQAHLLARRSGFCRYTPLPELGESAALEHGCSTGPEQNKVLFATGATVHVLGFDLRRNDAQPSAAQRELLVQVARSVVSRTKH